MRGFKFYILQTHWMNSKNPDETNKVSLEKALEATRGNRLKEIASEEASNSTTNILRRYSPLMAYEGDMVTNITLHI